MIVFMKLSATMSFGLFWLILFNVPSVSEVGSMSSFPSVPEFMSLHKTAILVILGLISVFAPLLIALVANLLGLRINGSGVDLAKKS